MSISISMVAWMIILPSLLAPFFNRLLNTNPLTLDQLLFCFALNTLVFWGVELEKLAIRREWLKYAIEPYCPNR
ncbi:MAG: hypothetical protein RLP44_17525 [Aggregatilineales bacterium]